MDNRKKSWKKNMDNRKYSLQQDIHKTDNRAEIK